MKHTLILGLVTLLSIGPSYAGDLDDIVSPTAQKIILPCAAGMILGQALGQDAGVGLSICGATAMYVMVDDYHDNKDSQILSEADSFLREAKKSLKAHMDQTKEEYIIYQEAVRKIILEKLSETQNASEKQIEIYMKTPAFDAFLKKKTEEVLASSDDVFELKLRKAKEEIRRQVTEDVLKDMPLDQ